MGHSAQPPESRRVLVPEGLFSPDIQPDGRALFLPLPPPSDEEVETLLATVAKRTLRLLRKRGRLDDDSGPSDAHQQAKAASLLVRLPFNPDLLAPRKRRCAFLDGFSLHANTRVHEHDRQGLEQLCRYGGRGALTLSRLSRRDDGRLSYRLKRPLQDGSTHLVLTPLELTRRLAALVPPPRVNLTRYHGVFASRSVLRRLVLPRPELPPPPQPPTPLQRPPPATPPRLDWACLLKRVFATDVLACSCGGHRKVLAFITQRSTLRAILDHLHLPSQPLPWASAQAPPQADFWH